MYTKYPTFQKRAYSAYNGECKKNADTPSMINIL